MNAPQVDESLRRIKDARDKLIREMEALKNKIEGLDQAREIIEQAKMGENIR